MARRDPALNSRKHRDHNRRYWQAVQAPCARCGRKIDYYGPEFLGNGLRNLRYLVVGHIVSRTEALAQGWSIAQINDLSNTQPECWECSITSGGNARAGRSTSMRRPLFGAPEASHI
jgi:hypothetical protein